MCQLQEVVCTASGNGTQAWQNLGQDKTRLASSFGCQSTKTKIVDNLQQNTLPELIRTMLSMGRPFFNPVFGPVPRSLVRGSKLIVTDNRYQLSCNAHNCRESTA